jgi:tetratricopeptide (TPR) repeat protein
MTAFLIEWDWEKAEVELLKALAANPNDAHTRVMYAHLLGCLQRTDESLAQGRLAIELDPLNPLIQVWYTVPIINSGDFETALAFGEKITATDPGHLMANSLIEAAAFYCREFDKGMKASRHVLSDKGVDFKEVERIYGETGYIVAYKEILRQLELLAQTEYVQPFELVFRYMIVDQPDKAMEWIEKGFEGRDPVMPYLGTRGFLCEPLFDDPRFIEFIQKMNLPLPEN